MSLSASWSGTKRMETLPTATRGMTEKRVGPNRYDASRACQCIVSVTTALVSRHGLPVLGMIALGFRRGWEA